MLSAPVLAGAPAYLAAPAPSTPLGPFEDSAVSWASWATLMSFVGLVALALVVAAPARGAGERTARIVRTRLGWAAVVAGVLALPAVLTDQAHSASRTGYDYGAAWRGLFDGSGAGLLAGLETVLPFVAALLILPVVIRRALPARLVTGLRVAALILGVVGLVSTRIPTSLADNAGRTVFQTFMWILHLIGGGVWVGGLIGLVVLVAGSGLESGFWSPAIRRFSIAAMSCVAAISLSGLFLYWEHVDGPTQLLSTMYGRVLGVKLLIFGSLLALGAVNQFWLHPRIDALRAAGDERPLRTVLVRRFPAVVGVETVLILGLLFAASFLHGSARNQAFQADAAKHATGSVKKLPKLPQKEVSASTWIEGTAETAAVLVVTVAGYRFSGKLARRRVGRVRPAEG
ncbi:copper resistance D domain protein [Catenulispora acidiphila DSM 44928]|uniref:Copper resistance D domain protein n=1 Tax=Catenulispora acidiphila (strain DSM 44928 / JCM 14897 / NBRC 102108 / NRRL B-24433 / ID139908) TaxID=479433 RepID=C7QG02_CATAD|nr:CopD family protein [Catenulispora acidiphila]ACU70979.1 copper resistance D domain protein [Catenulispora acidiphila DSM 44928]